MTRKQKDFIKYMILYRNASKAVSKAYPDCKNTDVYGHTLMSNSKIKELVDVGTQQAYDYDKAEWLAKVEDLRAKWIDKPVVQLKALELTARAKGIIKPDAITNNTIFTDTTKRKAMIHNRLHNNSDKPVDKL